MQSDDLIGQMRGVQAAERDLRDLGMWWQMIESGAAISCPEEVAPLLPTLAATRERFEALRTRLVRQMVVENQAELADDLSAKAQCTIDILVRNLFERTADVGFLATDAVVRRYCASHAAAGKAATPDLQQRAAMQSRLAEYQAKYSVYDDIVLLSPQGEVLARLDSQAGLAHSHDTIVAQALAAPGYVERFGASDLGAGAAPSLLYAHRITGGAGQALGVLVLRFRFADEMQRIFDSIHSEQQQIAVVLVDAQQRVVASNDEAHVPVGALVARLPDAPVALTAFAGREYLAVCRGSAGYQGYRGPAWRAQAMVSLLTAFRSRDEADPGDRHVPLDNPELRAMTASADAISRELRRVVWNGRLMAGEQGGDRLRLKAVLKQVHQAGARTRDRVSQAVQGIYRTAMARARRQTRELARLAADIVDRNLYERANDCRWWALSPALRAGLAAATPDRAGMTAVLEHINSLYTVYSRLVVFDATGLIQAASRLGPSAADAPAAAMPGSTVPAAWLQAVQRLADSQSYAVSPFEPTALHDLGATYVYLAAIRGPGAGAAVVGGIAIVFNAAAELSAMLHDVLGGRPGVAAFVDAQGQVLAATDAALAAGLVPQLHGAQGLHSHAGVHYACARVQTGGYREFKCSDGAGGTLSAVVGLRLGDSEAETPPLSELELQATAAPAGARTRSTGSAAAATPLEVAVFRVAGGCYALPVAHVLEAIAPAALVPTPGRTGAVVGMVAAAEGAGAPLVPVVCAHRLFHLPPPVRSDETVLLVLRRAPGAAQPLLALRVDDVLSVLDTHTERLHPAPRGFGAFAPWAVGLLDCSTRADGHNGAVLVTLLDAHTLAGALRPDAAATIAADAPEPPPTAVVPAVVPASVAPVEMAR